MIINVRGTSGSGKSTLVKNIMAKYPIIEPAFVDNRKQPIGYALRRTDGTRPLWVVGHYKTACGGGDTVPTIDVTYFYVKGCAERGYDVMYEGLIIQSDVRRCLELHQAGLPLMVIGLNTDLDTCLAGIQARRDKRGDKRALNPANTISKMRTLPRQKIRLEEGGVDFRLIDRDEAWRASLEVLGLHDSMPNHEHHPLVYNEALAEDGKPKRADSFSADSIPAS